MDPGKDPSSPAEMPPSSLPGDNTAPPMEDNQQPPPPLATTEVDGTTNDDNENNNNDNNDNNDNNENGSLEDVNGSDADILSATGLFNLETTPAFKILEYMKTRKEISTGKLAEFKQRLSALHAVLLTTFEAEKNTLKRWNAMNSEVTSQKLEMDKSHNRQFQENIEIGELKRELVKASNEHDLTASRIAVLEKEATELTKVRNELTSEIELIRRHQMEILEPQLIAGVKELKLDVFQSKSQIENLQMDFEDKQTRWTELQNDKTFLETEKERHISVYSKSAELPAKLQKQAEVFKEGIALLAHESDKQQMVLDRLENDQEKLSKRKQELEELSTNHRDDIDYRQRSMAQVEKENEQISKQHQLAKEELFVQREEKVRIDLQFKKTVVEIKRSRENILKLRSEKEQLMKAFRRMEGIVSSIKQAIPTILSQRSDILVQMDAAKRENKFQKDKIEEIRKDVDLSIHGYLQYEQLEKSDREVLMEAMTINAELEKKLANYFADCQQVTVEAERLKIERELKSRDLIRAQGKLRRVQEDSRLKSLILEDTVKRFYEQFNRSRELAKVYEILKTEKNKFLNQIQATKQRGFEMQDKIRILTGEVEILRGEQLAKDRELVKKRLESAAAISSRDLMRQECNKNLMEYRGLRDEVEQEMTLLSTLQNNLESQERTLTLMKEQYGKIFQERNNRVSTLMERNDELCLLYEKYNLQSHVLNRAELEMQDRVDDIKKLQLEIKELQREIQMLRSLKMTTEEDKAQLTLLEEELASVRMLEQYLSERVEDPFYKECNAMLDQKKSDDRKLLKLMKDFAVNVARLRPRRAQSLPGKDPSPTELAKQLNHLSAKISIKEELLLEKDMVLTEVENLSKRVQDQVTKCKEQSDALNVQINEISKQIRVMDRNMMSTVSELAMNQAQALRLERERNEKIQLLSLAQENIQVGKPPSEEMERAWLQAEVIKHKREAMEAREQHAVHDLVGSLGVDPTDILIRPEPGVSNNMFFALANGVRTTAVPRPNAYVPDVAPASEKDAGGKNLMRQLPIPKPYGRFAPLKPTDMAISLTRFTKKPTALAVPNLVE